MTITEKQRGLVATARTTGTFYLTLAVSGILGFLIVHPQIFDPTDAQKTLTNLIDLESIARTRLIFEFAIVISQALTAVWFYKLLKNVNDWAAWTVGIWGMVNSVVIMISAIAMGSAIEIAASALPIEKKLLFIELLSNIITNSWSVGGLFFGLWLIPLGYIVSSSKRMPIWLGRTLIIGGIGYILNTTFNYSGIKSPWLDYLTIPATIGEFWMIGYLLIYGIRDVHESASYKS